MNTPKHTQGPWKDYGHAGQINGADNSYICQVESKNKWNAAIAKAKF